MKKIILLFLLSTTIQSGVYAKLNIVATTSDFADFARQIGGDKVSVIGLTKGNQDLHYIEPRPSMVMKVKNADLLIRVGMDLDKWVQSLIDSSRNSNVIFGKPGHLDASLNITKMEIPKGKLDGRMGDIHIYGNPHYWLDPDNAKIIIRDIYNKLIEFLPDDKKYLEARYSSYSAKFNLAYANWKKKLKPFAGVRLVAYHNSWPYFANRFQLKIIDFIESKPGIPPNPSHIVNLIKKINQKKVKLILVEPYFSLSAPSSIAESTGIKIRLIPITSGGIKGTETYIKMMNYTVNQLEKGLR